MIGATTTYQGASIQANNSNISETLGTPTITETSTGSIVSNSISGTNITYSYGDKIFSTSGNFTTNSNGTIHEKTRTSVVKTLNIPLVQNNSLHVTDIIWEVVNRSSTPSNNYTYTNYYTNASFFLMASKIQSLAGSGEITPPQEVQNYSLTDTYIIANNQVVGSFQENVSYYSYTITSATPNTNVNLYVTPKAFIITYNTVLTTVELNQTIAGEFYAQYYSRYSVAYNLNASEWFAQIKDGNREQINVTAFKNLNVSYSELSVSLLGYYTYAYAITTLAYPNGTPVSILNYPFSLTPYSLFEQNGTITSINAYQTNMTAISTSSSVLQEFYAKLSAHDNNTQVNASALVAWMVSSTPRLIAYKDGNFNNQLDLQYSPDTGLQPTGGDTVPFIGISEAYHGTSAYYSKIEHTFDQKALVFSLFNHLNSTQKGIHQITELGGISNFGVGNVNAVTVNTYFNTPSINTTTHATTFNFGANYTNFPVTWVDTTNSSNVNIANMNIFYDYTVVIDPNKGIANVSPTVTFVSLDAYPNLKISMKGLGLAVLYTSDFLSLFALQAKTQQTSNVTASLTTAFSSLSFSGPGSGFSSVNTTGSKTHYTLGNGSTYNVGVSALNLITLQGTADATKTTGYSSATNDLTQSAFLQTTSVAVEDFQYR